MTKIKFLKNGEDDQGIELGNTQLFSLDAMELVWVQLRVWGLVLCCHGDQV
jgi:hypothetical protein